MYLYIISYFYTDPFLLQLFIFIYEIDRDLA